MEDNRYNRNTGSALFSPVEKEPEPKKKKNRILPVLLFTGAIAAASYLVPAAYYSGHFLPGTYIEGTDVSFLTPAESVEEILPCIEEKTVTIVPPVGEERTFAFGEILATATDGKVSALAGKIASRQGVFSWPLKVLQYLAAKDDEPFVLAEHEIPCGSLFSKARLGIKLEEILSDVKVEEMKPKDARIRYKKGDGLVIEEEIPGGITDMESVKEAVAAGLESGSMVFYLTKIEGGAAAPSVTKDDKDLVASFQKLKDLTSARIVFQCPGGEKVVLGEGRLRKWFRWDKRGNVEVDDELFEKKLSAFVDLLSSRTDTVWKERDFKSTEKGTVRVDGGNYGYALDKEAEKEMIREAVKEGRKEKRSPVFLQEEEGPENGGIGKTYVEVDIGGQKVYAYKDGEMVLETDCVTGTVSLGRDTPTGVYTIAYKAREVDLKGRIMSNGRPEYVSHVSYWMPFWDGCGLHDATWRYAFGGDIYLTSGSRGCINLRYGPASEIYDIVDEGTPVVIYKS